MGLKKKSQILDKYRQEYPKVKENLYKLKYDKIFNYIETNLL